MQVSDNTCHLRFCVYKAGQYVDLSTVPSVDSGDCFITCPKVHPEFFEHDTRRVHYFSEQKTGSSTTGVMLNKATDLAGQLLGYNKTLVVAGPWSGWLVEVNHKSAWAEVGSVKKQAGNERHGFAIGGGRARPHKQHSMPSLCLMLRRHGGLWLSTIAGLRVSNLLRTDEKGTVGGVATAHSASETLSTSARRHR